MKRKVKTFFIVWMSNENTNGMKNGLINVSNVLATPSTSVVLVSTNPIQPHSDWGLGSELASKPSNNEGRTKETTIKEER